MIEMILKDLEFRREQYAVEIAFDQLVEFVATDDIFTTNICFGGADMRDAWITLSGTGRLARTRWNRPGLKLQY